MDTDINLCAALQVEEYEVLRAIYPDWISDDDFNTDRILHLEIFVELPQESLVQVVSFDGSAESSATVSVLPPIQIDVLLPYDYPLKQPPKIIALRTHHSWLTTVNQVKSALLDSWQSGEIVLYTWVEFIRSGQFLRDGGSISDSTTTIRLVHNNPGIIVQHFTNHDSDVKVKTFEESSYSCAVCLGAHKGTQCIRISCSHVFCKECLKEFWTMSIRSGELAKVGCVDPGCLKLRTEATSLEVQKVVPVHAFNRWLWLREKREFDKDIRNVYCPRCEGFVKVPDEVKNGVEDAWTRLRTCSTCRFSFCKTCRTSWHGPQVECPVPIPLLTRYIASMQNNDDLPWRQGLELKYGRWVLERQIKILQEDEKKFRRERAKQADDEIKKSEEWISRSTRCCPQCGAYIQRTEGCDSMICSRCDQNFCYNCGQVTDTGFHRCAR
ncbi:hypothetical protein B0H34DRAFT_815744 [Crassisporium funariophilum]|nr:hypothetical protein B0H34DRAFT_815744 [Crassisporium funariophilum]